jgi:hypothetical protein
MAGAEGPKEWKEIFESSFAGIQVKVSAYAGLNLGIGHLARQKLAHLMNRMSGNGGESGMELGCAVRVICPVIVTTRNHSFDGCRKSAVPKGQRAAFTRTLIS